MEEKIYCPYCDSVFCSEYDFFSAGEWSEDSNIVSCDECGKEFNISVYTSHEITVKKLEEN